MSNAHAQERTFTHNLYMYIVQEVVPKYSHFINNIHTMAEGMTDEELIDIADKYKRMRLSRSDSQTFEDMNHRYTQGS